MNLIFKNLLLFGFLSIPFLGKSQFSYVGAGVALRSTTFFKPELTPGEKTKTKATTIEINGMYRPLRFFAIGATVSLPINQSTNFSFSDSKTSTTNTFNGFGTSGFGRTENKEFIPQIFDYTIEQSTALTIKARLYAWLKSGLYIDLRLSLMSLTERFIIERESLDYVPAIDINHQEKVGVIFPGFGIGLHEHLGKHVYIDLSINFDFMKVQSNGFSETVVYTGSKNELYRVTFEDQLSGKKNSNVLQCTLGYLF